MGTTERSYVADRTRFFLFIVPLPGGGGNEASTVKEGEKVINDKNFCKKFFDEIEKTIKKSQKLTAAGKTIEGDTTSTLKSEQESEPASKKPSKGGLGSEKS